MPGVIVKSKLTPTFGYNVKAGRYVSPQGRFVKAEQVRAALDTALQRSQDEIRYLSRDLQAGRLSIAEWQTAVGKEIRNAHRASAALAKGGWAQMTSEDNAKLGPAIKAELGYLARFGQQIEAGDVKLDSAGFLNRAGMYAQAPRATYHAYETAAMSERGMTEVRSILGVAEHCSQCVSEAARGWIAIGEEVPIGARTCLVSCHCRLEYR